MKKLIVILGLLLSVTVEGQQLFNGFDYGFKNHLSVGKNGYYPTDTTAWLEIGSLNTNKGFLPPRSDTNLIPKSAGSLMYEISANQFYFSDGHWWYPVASSNFNIKSVYNGLNLINNGGLDSISLGGNITKDIRWTFPDNPATVPGDTSVIEMNPIGWLNIYRNDTASFYDNIYSTHVANWFHNSWTFHGMNEYKLIGSDIKYNYTAATNVNQLWIMNNNPSNTTLVIDTVLGGSGVVPTLASNGSPFFSTAIFNSATVVPPYTSGATLVIKPTIVGVTIEGSASNVGRGDTVYRSVKEYIQGDGYEQYEKESYGIWIDPQTYFPSLGRGATYGIAQMGSGDMNYFAGRMQIGGNRPTINIPHNLYVVSDTTNTTGIQFASITSSSPATSSNGVHLTLDGSGNMILARDSSAVGDSSGNFIHNGTALQNASFNISGTGSIGGEVIVGGNLLIGKTSQINSSYMLDVNGNVRVNEIVVNTTGADYVLAPAYHLTSLDSLKTYIDQHHHLPGIPSAAQMKLQGMNVSDNQTILLQKVEELTLYLIAQNKEINKLQKKVDLMKNKLNGNNNNGN